MFLRPEIAAPTHVARLTALGLAFAGAGLFAIAKPALQTPAPQGTPTIAMIETNDIDLDVPVASQTEAPPVSTTSSRTVAMVFQAQGATWMKLENLAVPGEPTDMNGYLRVGIPKHGKVRYTREDYIETVIAPVAIDDVPYVSRERLGEKVIVDGTCTAYITGFAVVARLTGSPGYVGDDTTDEWTAKSVMQYGAPMLAAKLDGCSGTLARDASLPPAATPRRLKEDDVKLVAQAKAMLLRSPSAYATTKEWNDHYSSTPVSERTTWDKDHATTWKSEMFIHPTTHAMWISIHANQLEGCGSPHVNVWGLYRVEADKSLTSFDVDLGQIETIDQLIDLDGDGMWEVVGKEWLGTTIVNDAKGTTLETLDRPFYGCPC